jgi:hypothetical protein
MKIDTLHQLADILAHGPYAWPGGYPKHFLMADGGVCCYECVSQNRIEAFAAAPGGPGSEVPSPDPQWWPVAVDINWEDSSLHCDHCSEPVEAAYPDEEAA